MVFLLVEAFSFRPIEVAEMLSTTEGTIKALVHRARVAVRANADAAITSRRLPGPQPEVVRRYIDAFNSRDLNALFSLFHQSAAHEIVGDWEERGVEAMQGASFAAWASSRVKDRAKFGELDGRDVVLVTTRNSLTEKSCRR